MNKDNNNKLNSSYKHTLIFRFGTGAGFFSEYNNMLYAIAYCLINKIKFVLYSKDASFANGKGWNDFFKPFTNEVEDDFHSKYNKRFPFTSNRLNRVKFTVSFKRWVKGYFAAIKNGDKKYIVKYVPLLSVKKEISQLKKEFNFKYFTYELWCDFVQLDLNKYVYISNIFDGTVLSLLKEIDVMLWCYNSQTQIQINSLIQSLKLPEAYYGLHIRGGDKFIETGLFDVNAYFDQLNFIITTENINLNVFVLTDDYKTLQQARSNHPEYNVFSLCLPSENGYDNDMFTSLESIKKREQMLRLLASIQILGNSVFFIGTFSANPSQYLKLKIDKDRFVSLD